MPRRLLARIGIVVGAVALVSYWWTAIAAISEGRMFAYATYWNAPVGTITLLIGLAVLTPAWFWAAWRYWNWRGHKATAD